MTEEKLDFLEKVKIPEYERYGWACACNDMRLLIAEIRALKRRKPETKKK